MKIAHRNAQLAAVLVAVTACADPFGVEATPITICEEVVPQDVEASILAVLIGDPDLGYSCTLEAADDGSWSAPCATGTLPGEPGAFLLETHDPVVFEVCHDEVEPAPPDGDVGSTETTDTDPLDPAPAAAPEPQPPPQQPVKIKWPPDPATSVLLELTAQPGDERYAISRSRDAKTGQTAECDVTIDNKSTRPVRLRFLKLDQAKGEDRIENTRKFFWEPFKPDKSLNFDVGHDVTVDAGKTATLKSYGLTVAKLVNDNGAAAIQLEIVMPVNAMIDQGRQQMKMTSAPDDWLKKTITISDK